MRDRSNQDAHPDSTSTKANITTSPQRPNIIEQIFCAFETRVFKMSTPNPIAAAKAQEATQQYTFRAATPDDIPALQEMIETSLRALGKDHYTQAELDGSIGYLFGPDTVLIHDQ
tara:strand:- start:7096 stop:7440 length:345 start_codon:yes stop_codon:yes gene_type:complete